MKRKLFSVLTVAGLAAFLACVGCGSETPATTPATDAGATTDTVGANQDAGTKKDAGPPKVDPCLKCTDKQNCVKEKCVDKPCKDGCKAGEICDKAADAGKGKCILPACALPTTWGPNVAKLSVLAIADSKNGCDLNDDAVPDNALGALKEMAGGQLEDAVKKGSIVILLEPTEFKTDGSEFGLDLLIGDVDEANKECKITEDNCNYTVTPKNWDQTIAATTCPAVVNFPKATIKDGKLAAGGKDQVFDLKIPVTAGIEIQIKITQASVTGVVTDDKDWKTTKQGKICGVITKDDLDSAVDAIPEETLASLGGKATVKSLIDSLLPPDIDTDGDDEADAISVALDFETIPGTVVGLTAEATPAGA